MPERLPDEQIIAEYGEKSNKMKRALRSGSANPGETRDFINYILDKWDRKTFDISKPADVEKQVRKYFKNAADRDMKPTFMGVCNWLGITKADFNNWLRGNAPTPQHREIAQKAMGVIEEFWEISIVNGKMPTDIGKFLGERMFGYTAVSEVIITPNSPLDTKKDEEELRKIYSQNVVKEIDEESVIVSDTSEE